MLFRQVLYHDLGCASYVVADHGEAVVVDPCWDIDVYLEIADTEDVRITHVLDTHDHADHVSGRERLAAATKATIHRPSDESGKELTLRFGTVEVRALAAPGHRPEHRVFAVADLSRSPEPRLLLTGDSLLVGDVARPDLAYKPAEGARALHGTLAGLIHFGDHVEVWPGHVGGSLCAGAGLSAKTSSTIGFERRHNPLLGFEEARFVAALTDSLPTRPPNVDRIVEINRRSSASPAIELPALSEADVGELLARGITVLDSRPPEDFDAAHLAGSVNLPIASSGVGTRAGWTVSLDDQLVLVAVDEESARRMGAALQAVGFSELAGYSIADEFAWSEAELPVARASAWDLDRLAAELRAETVNLIDVREPHEWALGHVRGSMNLPLHRLREVAPQDLPDEERITAVVCGAGARAAFAASLLRRSGHPDVVRISDGGVPDLSSRGLELEVGL